MFVLGIDTSTRRVGVAVASQHGLLALVQLGGGDPLVAMRPRHAEQLVPAIEYALREAGVGIDALSTIAVSVGPGTFTGLRVGVTTAKVLGMALRIPLVPVASLDLVAFPLRYAVGRTIVAALDARRNEVYWARYLCVPGGVQRASEYQLSSADELLADVEARGTNVLLCGDGAARFRSQFEAHELVEPASDVYAAPDLAGLAELAIARFEREDFVNPSDVLPMYLRESDAELAQRRVPGHAGR